MTAPGDWWNAELAQYSVGDGEPVWHGSRVIWYEFGQERFRGAFDQGKANGDFTWWMENGQVVRKGSYVGGDRGWSRRLATFVPDPAYASLRIVAAMAAEVQSVG